MLRLSQKLLTLEPRCNFSLMPLKKKHKQELFLCQIGLLLKFYPKILIPKSVTFMVMFVWDFFFPILGIIFFFFSSVWNYIVGIGITKTSGKTFCFPKSGLFFYLSPNAYFLTQNSLKNICGCQNLNKLLFLAKGAKKKNSCFFLFMNVDVIVNKMSDLSFLRNVFPNSVYS